jgi:hypothetical protein
MGFGDHFHPSYNSYNGNDGSKNMLYRLTAKSDCVLAAPTERRLLFLHRGTGRAAEAIAHREYSRVTCCFPRDQAGTPVYTGGGRDVARGVYPLDWCGKGGIEVGGILANDG